jgi:FAD synthetase
MDEGHKRPKHVSPNGTPEEPMRPTELPDTHEVVRERSEGPLPVPEDLQPARPEVRGPRTGPPQMPTPPTLEPDEVRAARQGPPSMPSLTSTPPDEIRAPRQGPPSMPSVTAPRQADEIRTPRQGPPRMPHLSVPGPDEVRAARQGPPRMPHIASPGPADVRADRPERDGTAPPLAVPGHVEVRQDHPVRTELPPLHTDPGRVEIEAEGMRRKVRVMTTGVFDLLHLGHIHMLEAARALGDELYVVIARDETVRRMKHEPLNGEEIRRQIVENLKPVTKAVLGHVGDIYRTVQDVRPDVIALGYDQKFTEEDVRRKSLDHGVTVRVERLPQFDHDLDATRKIIERIGDRIAKKELYTQREG